MSGNETRRSVLQKAAGTAVVLAGSAGFTGSAAAASDNDYIVKIEGDADGTYQFKVPYGNDNNFGITDQDSDEGDEVLIPDDEDREAICEGTVGSDGEDEWHTTSTGKPFATSEVNCTVSVFERV